jgi:hypothetical protein
MPFLHENEFYLLMDNPWHGDGDPLHVDPMPRFRTQHIAEDGLKQLRDAGIQTTMPFECIWSDIEYERGSYNWDYLDDYVNRAARVGMKTILYTPMHGYPHWFPDEFFVQCEGNVVHREALSPWNWEALGELNNFNRLMMERYSSSRCLIANSQLSCGETVLLNEPAFYDTAAVKSYKEYSDSDDMPSKTDNMTTEWLLDSYQKMLVYQQSLLAKNEFKEIFIMLHPAIADMGLYGNGCNFIEEILSELTRKIEGVKINHIYYTWIQWQRYWGYMRYLSERFGENVFGGAEYAEGIPTTTPHAIANGLRGQIISPCYPGIHDHGVEAWMLNNITMGQNAWKQSVTKNDII